MQYTQEQLQIFDFVRDGNGHGIIDAVAGAGKTTTIIESTAQTAPGTATLFCAFNNSIAKEIARKFHGKGRHDVVVKTIHALGYSILKANSPNGKAPNLENTKYHKLIHSKELEAQLKPHYEEIIRINKLDPEDSYNRQNHYAVKNLLYLIRGRLLDINQKYRATLCKDELEDFNKLVLHFGIFNSVESKKEKFMEEVRQYYRCHQIMLQAGNAFSQNTQMIDFTDMLYLPYHWNQYPTKKFDFVFIDECQDLARAQLAVALKFAKKNARILAVGDPRQSIYGFTGADIESFQNVRKITRAKQLPLTTCFRCPQKVIAIAKEFRSDMVGNKKEDGIVRHIQIEEVITKARPNDLIICRIKAPLVLLVFKFINQDIKVQIHEDEAQEFVKELKNLFKQPERQRTIASIPGGFAALKQDAIKRWDFIIEKNAERIVDLTERQIHIKTEKEYLRSRLEFLHKKSEIWSVDCASLEDILRKIYTYVTAKDNPIKLSSIHRAKGLEEDRVFIIDYDKLPYLRLDIQEWEETQEINLKYVAVTRARQELYLVQSEKMDEQEDEGSLFDDLFVL